MSKKPGKQAVIVLGMHRSGTSLLAGICNFLGADLGAELIPAAEDNPRGFWENREVVEFHDEVLKKLNRNWDSVLPVPKDWWQSADFVAEENRLSGLLDRLFSTDEIWAVKDPRLCLLLPLSPRFSSSFLPYYFLLV